MIHELKTWTEYFGLVQSGRKQFEVRKNDRNYQLGDVLHLREYDPVTEQYTGKIAVRFVDYILHGGQFGIEKDYCILSLSNY